MTDTQDLEKRITSYILEEFLPGEPASKLTRTTPLTEMGILDSLATLRLVGYLENEFGISIEAEDVDPTHFNTIEAIVRLVQTKQS